MKAQTLITTSAYEVPLEQDTDVLIVGGGIVGCALAYYLARACVEVILIERDEPNTEASGANAGSLHLQLTSPFFLQTPREALEALVPDLMQLSLDAADEWRTLALALDPDIELKLGGGLMVAETDKELRLLSEKAKIERKAGLEAEILSRSDLHAVAPYLSERIVGAEFCPGEGKVNPLTATLALASAAQKAGGQLHRQTELVGLKSETNGILAVTTRGSIRCRRVVNAAGSLAGRVADMIGAQLPLEARAQHMNVTEPTRAFIPHLVQHAGRRLTLKQAAGGSVIIGGGLPARMDYPSGRISVLRESLETNLETASSVVPALGQLCLVRAWASKAVITDGIPILGEHPGVAGFYNAVPASSGYTTGPVCARLLADTLIGQRPVRDLRAFSIERF